MENAEFGGYLVGDYVIASEAEFDTFPETYSVTGFDWNMFGEPLIRVRPIAAPLGSRETVFYPRELRYEDGSSPS